ncbi:uncharacterized protein EDB91DRAFT_1149640 [Suillus paluster]|uniref:uncharacterized protein n=1 Tax=Suillus paluster TaxID=48578 RepID=UPI001B871A3C|nr:uncharacterized protein EDB91DRAFT_1149640 [Suillus paluster]KAG1733238.1 hypothetical protein EDB91DRAFT_1149640 [Suillus paluster]
MPSSVDLFHNICPTRGCLAKVTLENSLRKKMGPGGTYAYLTSPDHIVRADIEYVDKSIKMKLPQVL